MDRLGDVVARQLDYPEDGPAEVYALGVPPGIKIDDQMPAQNALAVLDAMATGRMRIDDFRMIVNQPSDYPGFIVWPRDMRSFASSCSTSRVPIPPRR